MPGVKVMTASGRIDHIKGNLVFTTKDDSGLLVQDALSGDVVAMYPPAKWLRAISDDTEVAEESRTPLVG
jgi:hypothetical protein